MDNPLKGHWGSRTDDDFLFQVASDFVAQLEEIMESERIDRAGLARKLGITRGRVSQILNDPGNLTLRNIVKYARALGQSVSIVTYERTEGANDSGPIPPQVFVTCWTKGGKPADMFSARAITASTGRETLSYARPLAVHLNDIEMTERDVEVEVIPGDTTEWSYARTNVL
jgi:transcriptional regulator with XRE-family HTH domain